jgi:hypothetical protein
VFVLNGPPQLDEASVKLGCWLDIFLAVAALLLDGKIFLPNFCEEGYDILISLAFMDTLEVLGQLHCILCTFKLQCILMIKNLY